MDRDMEKYWQNEIMDLIPTWREIADKGKQESGIRTTTATGAYPVSGSNNQNVDVHALVHSFLGKKRKGDMPNNRYFERREYQPMRDYARDERRYDTTRRFYENPGFERRNPRIGNDLPGEEKPDNPFIGGDYAPEERRRDNMRRFYENPAFDYLRRGSRYDQSNDMRDFMFDRQPRKSFRNDPYQSYRNHYYQRFLKEDFQRK